MSKIKYFGLLFSLVFSSALAQEVPDDAARLSWAPPVEREDGTSLGLTEIQEYRIYWGLDNTFDQTTVITDSTVTEILISDLPTGVHSFRMTAVDTDGLESSFSATVSKETFASEPPVVDPPPKPRSSRIE